MTNDVPNIFGYMNYREYLKDIYCYKKGASKGFSHRVFVRMCGFRSPNFLKLVMEGKRNLGKEALDKLASYLGLGKLENEYFKLLVTFNQSKSNEEKNRHFVEISRLHHRARVRNIEADQYDYLSRWYYAVIRELVLLDDFREDARWVNRKLKIRLSEKTLKKIIQKLIDLKLLRRDVDGRLCQTESNIVCKPELFSEAINKYHRDMIQKAADSIEGSSAGNRDISALTLSADRETFEKMRDAIRRCREEIHHLSSVAKSRRIVCQVNFQLFNILKEVVWD